MARRRKQELLGNHQKCYLWGKNVVWETLRAGRWPILELRVSETLPREKLAEVRRLAESRDIPLLVESPDELQRRCRSPEHQGLVAKMPPFPYDDIDTVLSQMNASPLFLVLDSIHDPHNFGAILRSAEALGVDAVFVAMRKQSDVTSVVARSSAGAVNNVRLCKVDSLVELAKRLRAMDVTLVAASEKGTRGPWEFDFRRPTAIVIGNEGQGISRALFEQCTDVVTIPQQGTIGSLNAAVSAGIVLYEAARQRRGTAQPPKAESRSNARGR